MRVINALDILGQMKEAYANQIGGWSLVLGTPARGFEHQGERAVQDAGYGWLG